MKKRLGIVGLFLVFSLNASAYDDGFLISDLSGFLTNIFGGYTLEVLQKSIDLVALALIFILIAMILSVFKKRGGFNK